MNCLRRIMDKRFFQRRSVLCIIALLITLLILIVIYTVDSIAPFGAASKSITTRDGAIQYLDFISYYKNVAGGDDWIGYTLNKGLGGNGIAIFAYYLASPFNLLFLLVDTAYIPVLYNVVIALKLGASSLTMSYYLSGRFTRLHPVFNIAISISYALMQYNIAQSCNIMWLDGVYMLPIMLLAIYRVVQGGNLALLAIPTGLSILFNWYTGAINCLWSVAWFFIEYSLSELDPANELSPILARVKRLFIAGIRYGTSMILGVCLSATLFLPAALELTGGRASGGWLSLDPSIILSNPLSAVDGWVIGSISNQTSVSLFCGSIVLIGCIAAFLQHNISWKNKVVYCLLLLMSIALFYWQPLFIIFSLFQSSTSYWFRYSYIAIFALSFIAANYYERAEAPKRFADLPCFIMVIPATAVACFVLAVNVPTVPYSLSQLAATYCFLIGTAALLCLIGPNFQIPITGRILPFLRKLLFSGCLILFLGVEMGINAHLLFSSRYLENNVEDYKNYTQDQTSQIEAIRSTDKGLYRINQIGTFNMQDNGLTANFNEGLAYGYPSVATYTSDPVTIQRTLLDYLGYPICGDNMNIVNTTILGADSLLGVRYVLSPYPIEGLILREDLPSANGKMVYENPFSLPIAFSVDNRILSDGTIGFSGNPFEYQNELYSTLLGREIKIYEPVPYVDTSRTAQDGSRVTEYSLGITDKNFPVYGNIILEDQWIASKVYIGSKTQAYSQWLAPHVLYIDPQVAETSSITLASTQDNAVVEAQFYRIDLQALASCMEELTSEYETSISAEGTDVAITASSNEKDSGILTTIPFDENWQIKVNGKEVRPAKVFECLMYIPLEEGDNSIQLTYIPKGSQAGLWLSITSTIIITFILIVPTIIYRKNINHSRRPTDITWKA